MLTNYHTHTTFCDGANTPEEMVIAAIEKGFDAIGFSGHGFTSFEQRYCMSKDAVDYIRTIKTLKEQYKNRIQIYLGAEEDAFDPVERSDFDYIIGSSHYLYAQGNYIPVDSGPEYFRACVDACNGDVLAFAQQYYKTFTDYILERKPDIIGHFDLITKYDELQNGLLLHNAGYLEIAQEYLLRAMESDGIFEVNTGAIARGYRTAPYPCCQLLQLLKKHGCKIMLNSDCHSAAALDCHFAETKALLQELGFRYVCIFTQNGFERVPL